MAAMSNRVSLSLVCDGTPWHYIMGAATSGRRLSSSVGVVCVGCNSAKTDLCAHTNSTAVIGHSTPCYKNGKIIKTSMSVGITQTVVAATTVPVVKNISITNVDKFSITARVVFTGLPPGGTVYCAAVDSKVAITNVQQIQDAAQQTYTFSVSKTSVIAQNLVLDGLVPARAYNVYCTGIDSLHNAASFGNVQQTQQLGVKTSCCRLIAFSKAPQSIYGNSLAILYLFDMF